TAGRGVGSGRRGDVLCLAGEPVAGDDSGCGDGGSAAWDYRCDWPCEPDERGGSSGSRAGLVGGSAGGGSVVLLLLGGAAFAGMGVGRGGNVAADRGNRALARTPVDFAGSDGSDCHRRGAGRVAPGGKPRGED